VATGLGLAAPGPTLETTVIEPSPTRSQLGGTWPTDGRVVCIVADPDGDLGALPAVRRALLDADVLRLVIAPVGGLLPDGTAVQRTFLTGRSVELDALILLGSPAPGSDAVPARDAKAGAAGDTTVFDPRVSPMLEETFRHSKAIAGAGDGAALLAGLGYELSPDVVTSDDADVEVEQLLALLATHRVWERFPASVG
jgi:catalase